MCNDVPLPCVPGADVALALDARVAELESQVSELRLAMASHEGERLVPGD
jgi:uncharacterized protein YceH (UPF0502 family)